MSELSPDDIPYTLGLDRLVDLDQEADFIGKSALQRIQREGVKRRLVGVEIAGEPLDAGNPEFWPVRDGERVVGHVTRCVYSPQLKKNIGFVNVPTDRSILGTEIAIDAAGGQRWARVVPIPFIEPKKKISR